MNYTAHLAAAKQLLLAYKPEVPLHIYLKAYFRENKKHGSKDRKLISALCYSFYRLGFAFKNIGIEEKILTGFFLSRHSQTDFLRFFKPEWNQIIGNPINEKLAIENSPAVWLKEIENIFPFKDELSNAIDFTKFTFSFLKQPKFFIRIRPGYKNAVTEKLQRADVSYEMIGDNCAALPNASKIDTLIELDKEAVVQDFNSQRVGELIKLAISGQRSAISNQRSAISDQRSAISGQRSAISNQQESEIKVWDCCAASGGKSIMAYDVNPSIQLTVSDKRESILKNLRQRFSKAGIKNYQSFITELTNTRAKKSAIRYPKSYFDLIIADVPCTGSGTWSRTPEQLYYFNKKQIKKYSELQCRIIENVMPYLNPGGWLLYITCSVFKKENEGVAGFIKDRFKMQIAKMELLKGYEIEADTLFAALFKAD